MKKRTKRLILIPILVLAILCGSFAWYVNDYYHAVDVSESMTSSGNVTVTKIKTATCLTAPVRAPRSFFIQEPRWKPAHMHRFYDCCPKTG